MNIQGHCLCGAIGFQSDGPVLWSGICHCESCRRATASPCTAFFGVPRQTLRWTGTTAQHLTSDGRVQRHYCPDCGTQMSYQNDLWPDEAHLYTANLLDPTLVPPKAHYHYAERLPWLVITDDLEKHAGSADS